MLPTPEPRVGTADRKRSKHRFSYAERHAVWSVHGPGRCKLCPEPLRLVECHVDHFIPESLLDDDQERQEVFALLGLPPDFEINSFANWMPTHSHCNQSKSYHVPRCSLATDLTLQELARKAPQASRLASKTKANVAKDKVFAALFASLEGQVISVLDLIELIDDHADAPARAGVPDDMIVLDNGYWIERDNLVAEGPCRCERQNCRGYDRKVYCYFTSDLSEWVVSSGLYRQCYDEDVTCPRCRERHRRGYVGRDGSCGRPYRDQIAHSD